jgi:hypothetical protein
VWPMGNMCYDTSVMAIILALTHTDLVEDRWSRTWVPTAQSFQTRKLNRMINQDYSPQEETISKVHMTLATLSVSLFPLGCCDHSYTSVTLQASKYLGEGFESATHMLLLTLIRPCY